MLLESIAATTWSSICTLLTSQGSLKFRSTDVSKGRPDIAICLGGYLVSLRQVLEFVTDARLCSGKHGDEAAKPKAAAPPAAPQADISGPALPCALRAYKL